mgnify:CR=1 FL=1
MAAQLEQLNTLILSRIGFYNLAGILEVYRRVGAATPVISIATSEASFPRLHSVLLRLFETSVLCRNGPKLNSNGLKTTACRCFV